MEKTVFSKTQYFVLLALSVITTFLLPLYKMLDATGYLYGLSGSANMIPYIPPVVMLALSYLGNAVLIFAAIRYRFRLCLPFAFAATLAGIIEIIIVSAEIRKILSGTFLLSYSIITILISCALPFAYIGIAKAVKSKLKKEAAVVLLAVLGMEIVSLIAGIPAEVMKATQLSYVSSKFDVVFYMQVLTGYLVQFVRGYLSVAFLYLLLRLAFAEKTHNKIIAAAKKVAAVAKRAWSATAK